MANTVAPETFAVAPLVPPTTTPDTGFRAVSAGVEGVRLAQAPRAAGIDFSTASDRSTLNSLMSLGVAALKPKVEQERMRQMGEGAIAAIQGQTAKELAEGDALMGVFGDPVAVAAARQVEKVTQLDRAMQEVQDTMDTWRTRSPEEFRKALPEMMKRHLTGDPLSDSLISRAFIEKVPALTDLHTRQHIAYTNQRAQDAFFDSAAASGESLKKYMAEELKGNMGNTADIQAAFLRDVAGSLAMLKPENVEKASTALVNHYAGSGNYQALKLLQDAGIAKAFSKEAQARMPMLIEQAKHNDWVNNPRYIEQYKALGEFEAAVREGIPAVADIERVFLENSGDKGGLKQDWVKQQTEQLLLAKARNARRAAEAAATDQADYQDRMYSQIMRGQGDLQTEVKDLSSTEKRARIDRDFAKNPATLEAALKRNGWLPTPVEAAGRAAINHAMVGQFVPPSKEQPGDIAVLRELSRLNTINPAVVKRTLGDDTYIQFLTLANSGALVDRGDPQKNQQSFQNVSNLMRENAALTKDIGWQRQREKQANAALSQESLFDSTLGGAYKWASAKWRRAPTPNEEQQAHWQSIRAMRVRSLAASTNLPVADIVKMVDSDMESEMEQIAGAPIVGNVGLEKTFKAGIAGVISSKGGMAFSGRLLEDVEVDKAKVRALEAKLQIPARKTTKRETAYKAVSAIYDGSRVNVAVQFEDGTRPDNNIYITAEDVAHEYINRNKSEFERTFHLSQ